MNRTASAPGLFDRPAETAAEPTPPPVIRPHYADAADVPRLAGQNAAILELLRLGPVDNDRLAKVARKYTGRISEIREWLQRHEGKTISAERVSRGRWIYRLVPGPGQAADRS